jgi:glycosyltransferase involved in cell wall biosynthesis
MDQHSREVGILIPTRNRPEKVRTLLNSLAVSSIKPKQVVVVSSGLDISDVILEYANVLNVDYLHSEISGQVNQKKLGCKLLLENLEWVIFLDDDLVLAPSCIENAINEADGYEEKSGFSVSGVGLALPSTTRGNRESFPIKLVGKIFGISNSKPGAIYRNGHAASYLDCPTVTPTQWLNGASMWKRTFVDNYGQDLISTNYAACEDLLFSYPISLRGQLIYVPEARVDFQDVELTDFEKFSVFKSAALWRLYFVVTNVGFSVPFFLFTQVGRNLFGAYKSGSSRMKFLWHASLLWVKLVYLSRNKSRIENALKLL